MSLADVQVDMEFTLPEHLMQPGSGPVDVANSHAHLWLCSGGLGCELPRHECNPKAVGHDTPDTNHGEHYIKDVVYTACGHCRASLTGEEVATLDRILAHTRNVAWVSREALSGSVLQPEPLYYNRRG